MSHRIKRFAAFAIFALFYHFAAVDSILGFGGHHVDTKLDTKTSHRNDKIKSIRSDRFWCPRFPVTRAKVSFSITSLFTHTFCFEKVCDSQTNVVSYSSDLLHRQAFGVL